MQKYAKNMQLRNMHKYAKYAKKYAQNMEKNMQEYAMPEKRNSK